MPSINWISEKDAAEMIKRKPRTLRKKVKAGLPIAYTSLNGRGILYNQKDIEKILLQNSTYTKTA